MTSTRSSREQRRNGAFRRVFFWQLKANRVLAAFYTFFLLISVPLMHLISCFTSAEYYLDPSNYDAYDTAESMMATFQTQTMNDLVMKVTICLIPLSMIFLICYGVSAFGFMHNRRSVDLFHAMPIRRTPMLMGTFMAGLFYLYLPIILSLGLCYSIDVYYGLPQLELLLFTGEILLVTLLMLTAVYTSCLFFCTVSGTLLDAVISIGAMNLGWPLLVFCVYQTMALMLPGFIYGPIVPVLTAFSPFFAAFVPLGDTMLGSFAYYSGIGQTGSPFFGISPLFLLWWSCITVLFLIGSVLYYKRRRSECAEDHFSYPVIRGVLRFLVSAGSGLGMGLLLGGLLDSNIIFLIGIVAGSAIAHVVSQAIWTHSFRRFWMTIPAYLFMLCCVGGFLYGLYADVTGFVHRLPDVSQVESLTFTPTDVIDGTKGSYLAYTASIEAVTEDYDYLGMISPEFTEDADIQLGIDYQSAILNHISGPYLPFENKQGRFRTELNYQLDNGFLYRREYYIDLDEVETADIIAAESAMVNNETYQSFSLFPTLSEKDISYITVYLDSDSSQYNASNDPETFTEADRKLIWETFLEELNSPDFKMDVTYVYDEPDTEVWEDMSTEETYAPTMPYCPDPIPKDRLEAESYFTSVGYRINFNTKRFEDLPRSYQDRLMKAISDTGYDYENAKPIYANGLDTLEVPECCPKTRQLIFELTQKDGEVYHYGEDEYEEEEEVPDELPFAF